MPTALHSQSDRNPQPRRSLCASKTVGRKLAEGWREKGDRSFGGNGVNIDAEIGAKTMATSDAQKRATKNYSQTEKGKEARLKAVQKHQATEHGQEVLKAAQERFEATEKRKAYRREWDRKNRARLRQEKKQKEENSN